MKKELKEFAKPNAAKSIVNEMIALL
jgi:hypothetical protein